MPRALSTFAMPEADVTPLARMASMAGARSALRPVARAVAAALPASPAAFVILVPRGCAPESLSAGLGGPQRGLGAGGDQPGLQLGHSDHLVEHEAAGQTFDLGEVGEPHVHAAVEKLGQEGDGHSEAVHRRDYQRTAV